MDQANTFPYIQLPGFNGYWLVEGNSLRLFKMAKETANKKLANQYWIRAIGKPEFAKVQRRPPHFDPLPIITI